MKHSKSSLFLMELIIALLFFSLSSTVCIRLFVNAHSLSAQTVDMNHAVNYAQNMAEIFTGCGGDLQAMQAVLPDSDLSPEGDWLSLYRGGYFILLRLSGSAAPGGMLSADISVSDAPPETSALDADPSTLLYTLHVELHIPCVKE